MLNVEPETESCCAVCEFFFLFWLALLVLVVLFAVFVFLFWVLAKFCRLLC